MDESPKTVQVSLGAFACTIDGFDDPARVLRQILRAFGEVGGDVPTGAAVPDRDDVRERVAAATGISSESIAVLPGLIVRHLPEGEVAPEPVAPPVAAPTPAPPVSLFSPTDGTGEPTRGPNLFLAGALQTPAAAPAEPAAEPEPEPQPEAEAEAEADGAESVEETAAAQMHPDPEPAEPAPPPAPASAADLVSLAGLSDPADLIAASAAWCTLGENRESAPRRAIMEAFLSIPEGAETTLGERVKALGGLVRDGRLSMAADGSFLLGPAERDRFAAYLAPPS